MTKYIFDVDGTLTPPRGKIDEHFAVDMFMFQRHNDTYMVSGSDISKSREQLGSLLVDGFKLNFSCMGNEVWQDGDIIYQSEWSPRATIIKYLKHLVNYSPYPIKTGKHIELRTGMLNYSLVGRNATPKQRRDFKAWDDNTKVREKHAREIREVFTDLQTEIGGDISIDIVPKGNDKSQILEYFDTNDDLVFFGDKTLPGGNDYTLAKALLDSGHTVHAVDNWQHTRSILKSIT